MHVDPFAPNKCLDNSLKTIVLQSYEDGLNTHVEFAKFAFVSNMARRASRCAQFAFVSEYDLPLKCWLDEGGFSRDDPFIETM
jgi:hypothetical protein